MGADSGQAVIPPPPDGSAIVASGAIPPPPDGSGIVPTGRGVSAEEQQFLKENPSYKYMPSDPKFPNRPAGIYPTGPGNEWRKDPSYQQNPVDLHLGQHTYEGAKAGIMAGTAPLALGASLPQLAVGAVGGTVGGIAGQQIAKKAGAGEFGQEIAGDVGGAVGGAVAGKAANLARSSLQGVAPKLYQSALKPSTTLGADKTAQIVQTGLKEQIPVSPAGAEKLSGLIEDLNNKIASEIASKPDAKINPLAVAKRTADVRPQFDTVNPEEAQAAISKSTQEYIAKHSEQYPMTKIRPGIEEESGSMVPAGKGVVQEPTPYAATAAQTEKQKTYQVIRQSYGELSSATKESQKALARGIKEELASQFPEISGLNTRESKLIQLDDALERAVARIGNRDPIGLGTPVTAGAVKAMTGSSPMATAAGTMRGVLMNPNVQSRLAMALVRSGKVPYSAATARIQSYVGALAAASQAPSNRTDQPTN